MDLNFPDFLVNDTVQNDNLHSSELKQDYLLLKQKICETHEVIKQYNDKLKECDRLKSDLDAMTKQTKKATCNYNSTLAKVIKLELQSTEYKKNIDTLTTQVNDHKIKAAADQQHIQQLICKIKEVEKQNDDKIMQYDLKKSTFEMKIKELESELKTAKKNYETKMKKIEKKSVESNDCHSSNNIVTKGNVIDTCNNSNNIITKNAATNTPSNNVVTKSIATNTCGNNNSIATKSVATNTCSNSNNVVTKNIATNTYINQTRSIGTITTFTKDEIMEKSEVSDKCILTDDFYNVKDNMYPIFCAKCEVHIEPTPFDKICKVMMDSCPTLIEKISSPLKTSPLARPVSDITCKCKKAENLIALPETPPPPHFHMETARSAFTSQNLPPPTPIRHEHYSHNFSQPSCLSNQSAFCIESTPLRVPLANTTTTSQTNGSEDKTLDVSSQLAISLLQDKVDTLAKKLRKKVKKLKSQKTSSCCQHSHPNLPNMFDMNSTMQFSFMEMWKKMMDMYQPKKSVVAYKPRNDTPKKSKLLRRKPTKRLKRGYNGNSWDVEPVSRKPEEKSVRKRPKKRKHRHSMLLKKSNVSIEDSEHLDEPVSDSDSNSYNVLFDTTLTNEDVSNARKDSSCEEPINDTCNDVMKSLTHSSAHSTDIDEPETVDSAKNSVEYSKSVSGETDSGILSDSVESSKLVQYEPDLDSCFLSKTRGNAKSKTIVKTAPSFAGNFESSRSQSTEEPPTNEVDKPDSVEPTILQEDSETPKASEEPEMPKASEEPEMPKASEEPEISKPSCKKDSATRKRKFGELEEPKNRLNLMKKIRNLKKKPIKIQTFPKLNIAEEAAYCESEQVDEKKKEERKMQPEIKVETVEDDFVPKKKARIAHVSKAAKKVNTSLDNCEQDRASLLTNVETKLVEHKTAIVNRTEPSTSIMEETNMTQETPAVETIAKEDNGEKLADKSSSETIEDISPMSPDYPDSPDEMTDNERSIQPKIIPTESVFDVSALIEQSAEARKGLEINLPARAKSIAETDNIKNDISGLMEQPKQTIKPLEINVPASEKSITETDNTIDISALMEQSKQARKRFEINLPVRRKSVNKAAEITNNVSALIEQRKKIRTGLEINLPACEKSIGADNITNNIPALIEQSEEGRKRLEINLPARKRPVTKTDNATNNISTLIEQSKEPRKGFEINLPAHEKSIRSDNTADNISPLIEQSEQRRNGFEINSSACKRPVIETDNIEDESDSELRSDDENNQPKEWRIANTKLNECLKEETEHNQPTSLPTYKSIREYRACNMNYYRDIKLNLCAPLEILERLNDENGFRDNHHKKELKRFEHVRAATDIFITKQLQRLADNEWESDVHWDVFEKLKTVHMPRVVAKNIVEFLSSEEECTRMLDKTYTPPAPLMTKTQQRLTALLVDLEKEYPMIIDLVQSGIEHKIFKFNQKIYKSVMESLARMFTVLARVQKDRERVRIFCCDALYCLGLNATVVLYTVITSWPEVLPSNETSTEYLPKCIAHLILSMTATDYPKLNALKNLVRIYYQYPLGTLSKDMIIDLLKAFQEKSQGEIIAALALLAKREGTAWTYKNIVKGALLPMIINGTCPSEYKAFSLLGTLMRPFPIEDEDKAVGDIVDQLCDLYESDEVSCERKEGVMAALMTLSRHKFNRVLPQLLKWTPNEPLRDRTVDQIYGLYNLREPTFWARYVRDSYKRKT